MLVQTRNQANRECLYAWYPEPVTTSPLQPRDIYILNGIDKNLLVDRGKKISRDRVCFSSTSLSFFFSEQY